VPSLLSVLFTGFNKHTSFLCYGIDYGRNKFYDAGSSLGHDQMELHHVSLFIGFKKVFNLLRF